MTRLLSRGLPLLAGLLLLAGSASALTIQYDMTGSLMAQDNTAAGGACTFATCNVAVTGGLILTDDEAGNVSLTNMFLSHVGYEVGPAGLISVVIDRDAITLGTGPSAGSGSTLSSSVLFGPSTIIGQTGTTTCTPIVLNCALAGLPTGSTPLVRSLDLDLGSFIFDGLRNLSGSITYTNQSGAIEVLTLAGTAFVIVPEPGTVLLLTGGLVGLALRRRARA